MKKATHWKIPHTNGGKKGAIAKRLDELKKLDEFNTKKKKKIFYTDEGIPYVKDPSVKKKVEKKALFTRA
jgi:hypothetical protein